jgi:hypothetical protein
MDFKTAPLKLNVKQGDSYVDVPVNAHRSAKSCNVDVLRPKGIATALAGALGAEQPKPITIRTERRMLRWVKPNAMNNGVK